MYGLTGLFPSMPFPSLASCDYGLSAERLFAAVTLDLLRIERGLKALVGIRPECATGNATGLAMRLPTWAIDFARTASGNCGIWWWDAEHRYSWFRAAASEGLSLETLHDNTVLRLGGIPVDVIE